VIARLPRVLAHAAGAAVRGVFYVIGGRGDALGDQRAAIWAIDPRSPRPRRAGRLPVALSDLTAVSVPGGILAVGGRDRLGHVHAEIWHLRAR
jgi:hypothetical protein